MNASVTYSWSYRLAWLMVALALLPISVGAVVTTVKAGMAFADWPTSDGHGMLAYPWLQSTGDKFLEHGHRLAGMLIGIASLGFTAWAFAFDRRPLLCKLALVILLGVIAQGVIGGIRVRRDDDVWALIHGQTAAWVFAAMSLAIVVSRASRTPAVDAERPRPGLVIASGCALLTVIVQYVLGGRLRHLGSSDAWLIHPWFAVAVAASVLAVQFLAQRQNVPKIQTASQIAVWLVFAQAALGLFTWGAKYGYPQWDILAERLSPAQVALSSLHTVVGLLTFAAISVCFVQIAWGASSRQPEVPFRETVELAARRSPPVAGGLS